MRSQPRSGSKGVAVPSEARSALTKNDRGFCNEGLPGRLPRGVFIGRGSGRVCFQLQIREQKLPQLLDLRDGLKADGVANLSQEPSPPGLLPSKLDRVSGPKISVKGTSAASLPCAMRIRPNLIA